MKNKILLTVCAVLALLFTGCASRIIDSSSTKIEVQNGKNKGFSLTFPKELQASKLDVSIDPATGKISLKADQLKSSSTSIIEAAGAAHAKSLENVTATLSQVMPFIIRAATGLDVPAAPEPAPAPVPAAPITLPVQPFVIPEIK